MSSFGTRNFLAIIYAARFHKIREVIVVVPTPKEIARRFVAYYQPIVALNIGVVAGFEALAGIDCGQGWFWSRAVSSREASRMLQEGYSFARNGMSGAKKF